MYLFTISLFLPIAQLSYSRRNEDKDSNLIAYYGSFSQPMAIMENNYRVCKEIVSLGKAQIESSVFIWLVDDTKYRYLWMHLRTGDPPKEAQTHPNKGSTGICANIQAGRHSRKTATLAETAPKKDWCEELQEILKDEHGTEEFKVKEIMLFLPQREDKKLTEYNSSIAGCMRRNLHPMTPKFWSTRYCHILKKTREAFQKEENTKDCRKAFQKINKSEETTKSPYHLSSSNKKRLSAVMTTSKSQKPILSSSKSPTTSMIEDEDKNLKSIKTSNGPKENLTAENSPNTTINFSETTRQFDKNSDSPENQSGWTRASKLPTTTFHQDKNRAKSTKDVEKQQEQKKTSYSNRATEESPRHKEKRIPRYVPEKKKSTSDWINFIVGAFISFIISFGAFLIWYITCHRKRYIGHAKEHQSITAITEKAEKMTEMSQSAGLQNSLAADNATVSKPPIYAKPCTAEHIARKKTKPKRSMFKYFKARREFSSKSISPIEHTVEASTIKSVDPPIHIR